jgi:transposase
VVPTARIQIRVALMNHFSAQGTAKIVRVDSPRQGKGQPCLGPQLCSNAANRTASSLRTRGGLNTKRHAVKDAKGRPLRFFATAGQISDYIVAAAALGSLSAAEWLIADRGYDADWFMDALKAKGICLCIPDRRSRSQVVGYDKRRYKWRHRIEIMFVRLKDLRRIANRYARCAKMYLTAVALAATVLFWL